MKISLPLGKFVSALALAALFSTSAWGQLQPQTINFNPPSEVEVGSLVTLQGNSSSGLAVSYTIDEVLSDPPAGGSYGIFVNYLEGFDTARLEPGVAVIHADQSGSESFQVAPRVTRTVAFQYPVAINFEVDDDARLADADFGIAFFPRPSALAVGGVPSVAPGDMPSANDVSLIVNFGNAVVEGNQLFVRGSGLVSVTASYVETGTSLYLNTTRTFLIDLGDLIRKNRDLDTWSWNNPAVNGVGEILGFADNGSIVVAVGRGGAVRTSTDGISWVVRNAGTSLDLEDVAYASGLNLFAAVGANGAIFTSPNGTTWTQRAAPAGFTSRLHGITFAAGRFVAVGENGSIVTSNNGTSWSLQSLPLGGNSLKAIAYGNGNFVAVGEDLTVAVASSALGPWNVSTVGFLDSFADNSLNDVAFVDGSFVAVGETGTLLVSDDGALWSMQRTSRARGLSGVYGEGSRVVVGGAAGGIVLSSDQEVWTEATSGFAYDIRSVYYFKRTFIAGASNGAILTSSSGVAWTIRDADIRDAVHDVAFNGSVYVAVGDNGRVFRSTNGSSWLSGSTGFAEDVHGVVYNASAGVFLAVGEGGTIFRSTNGVSWTRQALGGVGRLRSVAYSSGLGRYVAVGDNFSVVTSTDGTSWSIRSGGNANGLRSVAAGRGGFVAVGDNGLILFSENGSDWSVQTSAVTEQLYGVEFGGGRYVAVGANGLVMVSNSGTSWLRQESGVRKDIRGIAYAGNVFVAVGEGFSFLSSLDGERWDSSSSGGESRLNMVWSNGSVLVAVGDYGVILTSTAGIVSGLDDWQLGIPSIDGAVLKGVAYGNGVYVAVGEEGVVYFSSDRESWKQVDVGASSNINAVTFGNNRFVAVGDTVILHSTDGLNWNLNNTWFGGLRGVAYGNPGGLPTFVAVGLGGTAIVSNDGQNWALAGTNVNGADLHGVGYSNGVFVIAGGPSMFPILDEPATAIGTSTDGRSFNRRIPPRVDDKYLTANVLGVAAGNGVYMLVGDGVVLSNYVRYSEPNSFPLADRELLDPETGSPFFESVFANRILGGLRFEDIVYGVVGSVPTFAIVGDHGAIMTMTDGLGGVFETRFSRNSEGLFAITLSEDGFMAVGSAGRVLESETGRSWSVSNMGLSAPFNDVEVGPEMIVAAGDGGQLVTSYDGREWVRRDLETTRDLHALAFGSSRVVVVGERGFVAFSELENGDAEFELGAEWSQVFTPTVKDLSAVAFASGEFIAVGDSGTILSSSNANNWAIQASPTLVNLNAVIPFGDKRFIAVGDQGVVLRRLANDPWALVASAISSNLNAVATDGNVLVAVGDRGRIYRSSDGGLNWQAVESVVDVDLVSLVYANGFYLAAGADGTVVSSSSGISWSVRDTGTGRSLKGVTFGNGIFATVGGFGSIFTTGEFVPPQAQSIDFDDLATVRLGDQWVPLVARASSGLPVSFRIIGVERGELTGEFGEFLIPQLEGFLVVEAFQEGDSQFLAAEPVRKTISILKPAQVITFATIADMVLGQGSVTLAASSSEGSPVLFEVLDGAAIVVGSQLIPQSAGSVRVRAFTAATASFSESEAIQTFNVRKASQSIIFPEVIPSQFVSRQVALNVTASSGLPVALEVVSGPASINEQNLTVTRAGVVVVRATQTGNESFLPASPVERTIQVSDDVILASWRPGSFPVMDNLTSVASNGTRFVAVTSGGAIYQGDGDSWSFAFNANTRLERVAHVNGQFIAVGWGNIRSSGLYVSSDGLDWTEVATGWNQPVYSVAYLNGTYFFGGIFGKVFRSTNLLTFVEGSTGRTHAVRDLAVLSDRVIAVGDSGFAATTVDGVVWTEQRLNTQSGLTGVAVHGATTAVISNRGEVFVSVGLGAWTRRFANFDMSFNDIEFGSGRFLVVGGAGKILFSTDAQSWSTQISDAEGALLGVAISASTSVAVGSDGLVIRARNAASSLQANSMLAMNAAPLSAGWFRSAWFGVFNDRQAPWIYSPEWGWLMSYGLDENRYWMYQQGLGWLWITESDYPHVYSPRERRWLYLGEADSNGFWVYDYSNKAWSLHSRSGN